jgi:hypothetical protein
MKREGVIDLAAVFKGAFGGVGCPQIGIASPHASHLAIAVLTQRD